MAATGDGNAQALHCLLLVFYLSPAGTIPSPQTWVVARAAAQARLEGGRGGRHAEGHRRVAVAAAAPSAAVAACLLA